MRRVISALGLIRDNFVSHSRKPRTLRFMLPSRTAKRRCIAYNALLRSTVRRSARF